LVAVNGSGPPCDLQNGPRIDDDLARSNNPAHTPSSAKNQALTPRSAAPIPPGMVDDRGESDLEYFTARPSVDARVRLPIDGEFPPGVLEPGRVAFVHVFLASRDPVTNAPGTRARAIFYSDIDGGSA